MSKPKFKIGQRVKAGQYPATITDVSLNQGIDGEPCYGLLITRPQQFIGSRSESELSLAPDASNIADLLNRAAIAINEARAGTDTDKARLADECATAAALLSDKPEG